MNSSRSSMLTQRTAGFQNCWYSIVQVVQILNIYEDCKTFVDMPVLHSWPVVEQRWAGLRQPFQAEDLREFISQNFGEAGSDLKEALPEDWDEDPPRDFLGSAPPLDARYADLARKIYGLWPRLCRKGVADVASHADQHTLIPLPHEFIIPGDRFRECYNWDTYWILRGLLAGGMVRTAERLLENLLYLVDRFGFVPNGARTYYVNRSQPPLLSAMVRLVWEAKRRSVDSESTRLGLTGSAAGNGDEGTEGWPSVKQITAREVDIAVDGMTNNRLLAAGACPGDSSATESEASACYRNGGGAQEATVGASSFNQTLRDQPRPAFFSHVSSSYCPEIKNKKKLLDDAEEKEKWRKRTEQSSVTGNTKGSEVSLSLAAALPRLLSLHRYWTSGPKLVLVRDEAGSVHSLSRYYADLDTPRPESMREDEQLAASVELADEDALEASLQTRFGSQRVPGELPVPAKSPTASTTSRRHVAFPDKGRGTCEENNAKSSEAGLSSVAGGSSDSPSRSRACRKRALFRDLASAAESGWDFSSRWFVGGDSLVHTATTRVIPTDLNAWLFMLERDIAEFARRTGAAATACSFARRAEERRQAINGLMWDRSAGCWRDLLLHRNASSGREGDCPPYSRAHSMEVEVEMEVEEDEVEKVVYDRTEQRTTSGFYVSNWVPLACGCTPYGSSQAATAVQGLIDSGLLQACGVLTSTVETGQQWDAPNCWPPLVQCVVQALEASGAPGAADLAADVVKRFVDSAMKSYGLTGHMHEKYNAFATGGVGQGGEYKPQVGFGWTNGVVLDLLRSYPGVFQGTPAEIIRDAAAP